MSHTECVIIPWFMYDRLSMSWAKVNNRSCLYTDIVKQYKSRHFYSCPSRQSGCSYSVQITITCDGKIGLIITSYSLFIITLLASLTVHLLRMADLHLHRAINFLMCMHIWLLLLWQDLTPGVQADDHVGTVSLTF